MEARVKDMGEKEGKEGMDRDKQDMQDYGLSVQ